MRGRNWLLVPLALWLTLFLLIPMAFVIVASFQSNGQAGFTLANYASIVKERHLRDAFLTSFLLSFTTTVVSLVLGFILSYAIHLARGGTRQWLSSLTSVPLAFSGLVVAFSFIITFGASGVFTLLLNRLFGVNPIVFSSFLTTWKGLSFAYLYFLIPRVILTVLPAWEQVNWNLVDAAESLGARPPYMFRRVLLPQLLPSVVAGSSLVFAVAMGAYGTAFAMTGVGVNIVPLAMLALISEVQLDFNLASALAVGLTIVTLAIILIYESVAQRAE
jgi:ABC-type uncharacterized transport system permease subunit